MTTKNLSLVVLFPAVLALAGCGGGSATTTATSMAGSACPQPFIDRTAYPTQLFVQLWLQAQGDVAKGGLALNARSVFYQGATPVLSPPEPRAMNIQPCGLSVIAEVEVPAAELNMVPNCQHCPYIDPTGLLRNPDDSRLYCNSWTGSDYRSVHIPASKPENARYEFSVIILHALGYPTSDM